MLNAGLGALADEMWREPGHQDGDPLICPTTRLEIISGGGCTNRHFWVCECGKRVAAVYQHPEHQGLRSGMTCAGYTYECLLTSGRGAAKNPERRILKKRSSNRSLEMAGRLACVKAPISALKIGCRMPG